MTTAADLAVAPPTPPDANAQRPMFQYALAEIHGELMAIAPSRLVPLNVDVAVVVTTVLGAAPEIRALRPRIVEVFGEALATKCDRLELLARALGQASSRHRALSCGDDVVRLAEQASEERATLASVVQSLAARKIVSHVQVPALRGGSSARNAGFDLLDLCTFLKEHWAQVQHATGYSREEIDAREGLANQLITAIGVRDQPGRSETADLRQRAFTLLYEEYDEVRAMVSYLRWKQGDGDSIAPSLWTGRGGRRRATRSEPAAAPTAPAEVPAPGMPGAPAFEGE